jgi:hypothetical protein
MAAGAAKQATVVEASLARKNKKAEKAKRRQEKEMEIARQVGWKRIATSSKKNMSRSP